jgi:hypothetical protein
MADMTPKPISGGRPALSDSQLDELLGAYALNAVDADEVGQVDEYLRRSPRARGEMAGHLEVAAALGSLAGEHQTHPAGEIPSRLWDGIIGKLPSPPLVATSMSPLPAASTVAAASTASLATPTSLADRRARAARPRWRSGAGALLVAASITAVGGLTTAVVRQGATIDRLEAEVVAAGARERTEDLALQRVLAAPGTQVVRLTDTTGEAVASIALASDGTGFVFGSTLPPLPAGTTYQLWGVSDGVVLSLGIFGTQPSVAPFAASGRYTQLVMTAESGPGVVASTADPVASATLA